MAWIVGKALGRRVRLVPMPLSMFLRAARLEGLPIALLAQIKHYVVDHAEGAFEHGSPNDHVLEVTGRAPETFESVARRHAARIDRGFGAALKVFARFLIVPMVPPPPVERYLRGLHMPETAQPVSATRSSVWQREHGGEVASARAVSPVPQALRAVGE
jgi:hypothetical protein